MKNKFMRDFGIYTASSVFLNILGMLFRIYVSNRIGAEGMGLHSLVYSVYTPAVTLATSAVNLASTRLVTEAVAKNKRGSVRKIMLCCFVYSLCFGAFAFCCVFFGADFIAQNWIKDPAAVLPLRILSFGLPFLSISSALHGAFTALRKISKSVAVQITEDLVKIGATVMALSLFVDLSSAYGCVCLVLGSAVGEFISCVAALILYKAEKLEKTASEKASVHAKKLFTIALPTAFSSYLRSGISMFEKLMVPVGFGKYGLTQSEALSFLGLFSGMVYPVVFFPATLLNSFSRLIVPEIAAAYETDDKERIESIAVRSIKTTLIFAIFVSGIFILFADLIGNELYSSAEAGLYIRVLSPLVPLMYLDSVVDSLLKGLNQQVASMRINIFDSAIRTALVCFLLPVSGFEGYVFITYFSTIFNGLMSIRRLVKVSAVEFSLFECFFRPLFYTAAAILPVFTVYYCFAPRISVFFGIGVCALLYFIYIKNELPFVAFLTKRKPRKVA